jgi:hypothetical protein
LKPLYLTAGNHAFFISYFATYSATIVHTLLFHHRNILDGLKSTFTRKRTEQSDIHRRLNSVYPDAPQWWFIVLFLLALAMAFGALTVHVPEAPKWVQLSVR